MIEIQLYHKRSISQKSAWKNSAQSSKKAVNGLPSLQINIVSICQRCDHESFDPSFIAPVFLAALLASISFCLASLFSSRCLFFSSSASDLDAPVRNNNFESNYEIH